MFNVNQIRQNFAKRVNFNRLWQLFECLINIRKNDEFSTNTITQTFIVANGQMLTKIILLYGHTGFTFCAVIWMSPDRGKKRKRKENWVSFEEGILREYHLDTKYGQKVLF